MGSWERAMMCRRMTALLWMEVRRVGEARAAVCKASASVFMMLESTWGEGVEGASPGLGDREGHLENASWEDSRKRWRKVSSGDPRWEVPGNK